MYTRKFGVIAKSLADEVLLIDQDTDAIFNLNLMGTVIWNYLREPRSGDQIQDILTAAFPDVPAETIAADTNQLLQRLVDKGLLVVLPD